MPEQLASKPQTVKSIKLWQLLGVVMLMLWLAGIVLFVGYEGRKDLRTSIVMQCKQAKHDRVDIAGSLTAHKTYIENVVLAQSVKEDVKEFARTANETHTKTALALTNRSKIDCVKENPKARLLP